MPIPFAFDFKIPDYKMVFDWRMENLNRIKKNPEKLPGLKEYYKNNIAQFIIDWGVTADPRNVERGLPAVVPFILFEKQEEWVHWFIETWKNREPGLTEKSRDLGLSWLAMAVSCSICLFNSDVVVGVGSRKEEYVDKKGDPKSLLFKARQFIENLPYTFRGDWDARKHSPYMRIEFPATNSIIAGEAGDNLGRGARTSFTIVDEFAFFPRPAIVDAALSQTTNCRHDISTPWGSSNSFARKRFGGHIKVFTFAWQDDPRKDQAWYEKQVHDIDDPVIVAQEIDLNYNASMEGIVIPAQWVQASIDAHLVLGVRPTGIRKLALDIADEGKDKNAACGRHGILLESLDEWSGKGSDIFETVEKAFLLCDTNQFSNVDYDADGLGAGVRGDARQINIKRRNSRQSEIKFNPFRGSGAVVNPTGSPFLNEGETKDFDKGRTNEDFFENAKAQAWWALRRRFQMTYRAVVEKQEYNPEDIISISSQIAEYKKLMIELSQPTWGQSKNGKLLVNKMPDGSKSPNKADAVMICYAPMPKLNPGFFS